MIDIFLVISQGIMVGCVLAMCVFFVYDMIIHSNDKNVTPEREENE